MMINEICIRLQRLAAYLDRIPHDVIAIAARLGTAGVFWQSARTKVQGFSLTDTALFLFREEYRIPLVPPEIAAVMATTAEHLFSVLLVLGLATRVSAAALLGMTLVIEVFVYPLAWPTHLVWATCFLYLIGRGPGTWSLDALIARQACRRAAART